VMRVLLCPIGSRGFVYPMIGVARRLHERGHQVAFATSADFEGVIAEAGFERLPRGNADGASFQLAIWAHPVSVSIQVRHVLYAVERFRPDVMLCSTLALGPLIAGELAGLQVAVLGLATYLWPVPVPGGTNRSADHDAEWRHRETLALYNSARALFGLSALPGSLEDSPLLGALYLLQSVPLLETLTDLLPDRVRFVGSCLYEPETADAEVLEWLDWGGSGRRLVYAQHGSVFRTGKTFWDSLVAASDEVGIRVAAAMERNREAPPAFRDANWLVRGYVPQQVVMGQADGVVCSANTTAMLGALTHGLPALVFPTGGEQHALAARLLAAGAVGALPPSAAAGDVRAALERILARGPERQAARRLQAAFAAFDGPGLVVAALEELAVAAVASGVA
jgi:UDP:flavonoid glycosyltransferase YjiC (YdhE family)